jgi:hypothetical protein
MDDAIKEVFEKAVILLDRVQFLIASSGGNTKRWLKIQVPRIVF